MTRLTGVVCNACVLRPATGKQVALPRSDSALDRCGRERGCAHARARQRRRSQAAPPASFLLAAHSWSRAPVSDFALHNIPGRDPRKLLELASYRGEAVGPGTRIELPLSQQTLAGLVGASPENVNRILRVHASLGLIELGRGRITLLRPDELIRRTG